VADPEVVKELFRALGIDPERLCAVAANLAPGLRRLQRCAENMETTRLGKSDRRLGNGEDYLLRPVIRGMCGYESLVDGTLDLHDIFLMNEALDIAEEKATAPRKPKRRGRPPTIRRRTAEQMRELISRGKITEAALAAEKSEALGERFGVDRQTAQRAREDVLGQIQ
jgi:hypothetical protein